MSDQISTTCGPYYTYSIESPHSSTPTGWLARAEVTITSADDFTFAIHISFNAQCFGSKSREQLGEHMLACIERTTAILGSKPMASILLAVETEDYPWLSRTPSNSSNIPSDYKLTISNPASIWSELATRVSNRNSLKRYIPSFFS